MDQLDFLGKLQRILGEGLFVASYKYALILAFAELSVEKSVEPGDLLAIPLEELSERFIALYWRQTAPFAAGVVLAQNRGRQASAIKRISEFRAYAPTLAAARRHRQWRGLVTDIGRLLLVMPLWKLQRVGADRLDFLYEERLVDGAIVLRPGIASCFQQQFGIVQALVQMGWLSFVQRLPPNRELLGSTGDLADFLFGSERAALGTLIAGLTELQTNQCFYCGRSLSAQTDVDHFIPWSRYPRDLGHNFVLAHRSCNQNKAEMLAAAAHLERWLTRNHRDSAKLQEILAAARFVSDPDASFSVTEWAYEHAERAGSLVWVRGRETCRLSPEWRRLFT
ncbi:MAG: HNH endonuclease domain-containing protein [Burkholderiales bacterium]